MESLAGDMLDTDLYSDLKEEDAHDVAYSELRDMYTKLQSQCSRLQIENKVLSEQNVALKKNISCLYKTAKAEIERKDREISELRKRGGKG
ncbi:CASP8-associated protein 2-like [Corticium candelabrum]|uniref:CASP8-associated protein 2-like n=1 Tax=Corticium candelabrum TaxID=121492 RepID=UPI002E254494|nr:CASP8-associated protein 2-like [Corticium candelabrum]